MAVSHAGSLRWPMAKELRRAPRARRHMLIAATVGRRKARAGDLSTGRRRSPQCEIEASLLGRPLPRMVRQCVRERTGNAFHHCSAGGPPPAKDRELIAGFIHGAITVDAFRYGQCWTARVGRSDEFGRRAWAKARKMRGVVPGRHNFEYSQTVLAVSDEGKSSWRPPCRF